MPSLATRPEPILLDVARSALVVVDMQNAFASPGGMFDLAGHDISGAAQVIETHRRLLPAARRAGLQIVYLQMSFRPDLSDAGEITSPAYHKELALRMMRERPELEGKLLIEGSWDWRFVEGVEPVEGDIVIRKSRYNGFVGTELDAVLREHGIRHLLFSGIATNVCVDSTARSAFFNDFWPILVEDAMNHAGPDFTRRATIWNFENVLGWVTDTPTVLGFLDETAAARP